MAKKLHKVDVDVKLLRSSQGSSGHGEFLIQEKNKVNTKQDTATQDVDLIFSSNGIIRRSFPRRDPVPRSVFISFVYFSFLNSNRTENLVSTLLSSFSVSRSFRSKLVHQASWRFPQKDSAGHHQSIRLQDHRYFAHGNMHDTCSR